ncbi:hypothetical protein B296_00020004 [Ensete ventricosum]|uniref:Uncharacterized protein n=1 Tax=Ensete ventricosum TaxID=4639 RepID=A0A427APW8_ENSVE|nr:hypothetical protein B296_00020004 [Ensete ventricosum]
MEKFQSGLWRFRAIFRRRDREFEKRSPCKLQWRVFIPIKRRGTTFNGCSAFGRTVGTILRQAAPSLVRRISISGSDNREYNAQSNRRDLRPGVSGLLGLDDSTKVPPLRYHGAAKPMALLSVALHLRPFLCDHVPLHRTHWYLQSDFSLGGTQPLYADDQGFHLMQASMRTHGRPASAVP